MTKETDRKEEALEGQRFDDADTALPLDTHVEKAADEAANDQACLSDFSDKKREDRRKKCREIGKARRATALPYLRINLDFDPDWLTRVYAAQAILRIAGKHNIDISTEEWRKIALVCFQFGIQKKWKDEQKGIAFYVFGKAIYELSERLGKELLKPEDASGIFATLHEASPSPDNEKRLDQLEKKVDQMLVQHQRLHQMVSSLLQIFKVHHEEDATLGDAKDETTPVIQPRAIDVERRGVPSDLDSLLDMKLKSLSNSIVIAIDTALQESRKKTKARKPSPQPLLGEQEKIFEELDKLGSDIESRRMAEAIVNERLAGERVTEALVIALRQRLEARDWGIKCLKCGEPALPTWTPRGENQGSLQFAHSIAGEGYVKHFGRTKFPRLRLISRAKPKRGGPAIS